MNPSVGILDAIDQGFIDTINSKKKMARRVTTDLAISNIPSLSRTPRLDLRSAQSSRQYHPRETPQLGVNRDEAEKGEKSSPSFVDSSVIGL